MLGRELRAWKRHGQPRVDAVNVGACGDGLGYALDEQARPEHVYSVNGEGAAGERPVGVEEAQHPGDRDCGIVVRPGDAVDL